MGGGDVSKSGITRATESTHTDATGGDAKGEERYTQ